MARDERKLLEDIALDIMRSDYGFTGDLNAYMNAVKTVSGLTDMELVNYVCK